MQTLLLACYICLQLTLTPDLMTDPKSSCNVCFEGLSKQIDMFDRLGQFLVSNPAIREILEEKLKIVLLQSQTKEDEQGIQLTEEALADLRAVMKQQGETIHPADLEASIKKTLETKYDRKDILLSNIFFVAGNVLRSENGEYKATMMKSGQVIITDSNQNTVGTIGRSMTGQTDASHYLMMQGDGNLVIYNIKTIIPIWNSGTYTRDLKAGFQYYLKLENNGQLMIYNEKNMRAWASGGSV